jgi:PAS domain S-box-containing protein
VCVLSLASKDLITLLFLQAALGRNQRAFSLSPNTAPIEPHQQSMNYYPLKDEAVPRSLQDALRMTSRAVVITETTMPFPVFNVNKAWENLCGYTYRESKGKSLGDLLKGPETDPLAVTALLSQLLRGEDATTILTNYKKSGEKFQNRLRVGPLYNEDGKITHFVGILQQV